ncbi:MAG: hypothetical protein Q4D61_02155 [Cardiobacteriaceae bacterium]|nr:hypothetical protein [Cardiobacteriaceae bacterium]
MLRRALLLFAFASLAACGFHLKGMGHHALQLDGGVRLIVADVPEEALQPVREAFARQGVALDDGADARYVIRLGDFTNRRFESAVGGIHGQSRVLDLRKAFTAHIEKDGETLGQQTLASETSITYHSEQYLGNLADDERAQHSLNRDNADKLLRFFQATVAKP